jgi:hypothetical protein
MRSIEPTEVPPNFWTINAIVICDGEARPGGE